MTRVALLGNYVVPWTTETHLALSLGELGHRVLRLQENQTDWRVLPRQLRRFGAEVLIWVRTWDVDRDAALSALADLRAAGVATVSFHLDRWLGLEREYQLDEAPFFRTDLVVTADGTNPQAWADRGINHRWLPPGVLARECRSHTPRPPDRRFPHDIVFVGSHPYPHPDWAPVRGELLTGFAEHFGPRFKVWPDRGRPVRGLHLNALYQSAKVVLGDSCLVPPVARYFSDRVPETLGRGGCLIHPWVEGIDAWYPDLPTFAVGDVNEAIRLTEKLLEDGDQRAQLTATQRALVLGRDTYTHRMASLLDMVAEL